MSRHGKQPKLDLRLNLSTRPGSTSAWGATGNGGGGGGGGQSISPHSSSSSSSSSPSSCVSSETEQGRMPRSPEAASMVLVGCPRCLMYVMLLEEEPRCPKCKNTVLLDFLKVDPKSAINPPKKTGTS